MELHKYLTPEEALEFFTYTEGTRMPKWIVDKIGSLSSYEKNSTRMRDAIPAATRLDIKIPHYWNVILSTLAEIQ